MARLLARVDLGLEGLQRVVGVLLGDRVGGLLGLGLDGLDLGFPNERSALRLATAVLAETSDEWETGRLYLSMEST